MSSSPLDCPNGLTCRDYECELRHLDAEEQTIRHQAERAPKKSDIPKLIVTASRDMGRSASTWVFNAVRLLYRQTKTIRCDSYWIRSLSKDKLRERLQQAASSSSETHVLIKTHEQRSDQFHEVLPLCSHIIVSVRQGFSADPNWLEVATHVIRYEDIVDSSRVLGVLRGIARHLGIDCLTEDDLRQVDHRLMTLPIPGDQSSKFWPFHARRGGRTRVELPATRKQRSTRRNIFVTRHGARMDHSDRNWLQKAGHGRRHDTHLSALGYREAKELADELSRLLENKKGGDESLDHIVSSPFVRCMETADAVAEALGLSIKVEPGIAEVGSDASQMASPEELGKQFSRMDPDYVPAMSREELSSRSEYGDGAAARRASEVARTVADRLEGSILFVGHGASCLGLVSAFGAPQQYIGYCSLTHFQLMQSSNGHGNHTSSWQLVKGIGQVSHLSDPQASLDSAW